MNRAVVLILLNDLGQVSAFWASISSSVKWGDISLHDNHKKLSFSISSTVALITSLIPNNHSYKVGTITPFYR